MMTDTEQRQRIPRRKDEILLSKNIEFFNKREFRTGYYDK